MNMILGFVASYVFITFALCLDNIFWISASPEYSQFKTWSNKKRFRYILVDRVWAVIKNPRDIFPALISSFIFAIVVW